MKTINFKWTYLLANALLICCLAACSNNNSELDQIANEHSSRAELITADIPDLTAGNLSAKLVAKLGENSTNVQVLTLAGEFNATDAVYLETLTKLQELDMSAVTIKESTATDENGNWLYYLGENEIGTSMFINQTTLTKLIFPQNITSIKNSACEGCKSLTSIIIPNKVTTIEWRAFAYCTSLASVEIPINVEELGGGIFDGDTELTSVKLLADVTSIPSSMFQNCSKLENIELNPKITQVENSAFSNCTALKDYAPFAQITTIQDYAFTSCGFTSLDLSNVTTLNNAAFRDCETLTSVKFSDALTSIGNNTFQNCTSLTTVPLPTSFETIGNSAFNNCTSLATISLPATLKTIGDCAFERTALTSIDIPASVTTIESGAFNSTRLFTLTIPSTVLTVTGNIIYNCNNLVALFWNSSAEVYDLRGNTSSNCYLYLTSTGGKTPPFGPNWKNVIIDGVAETIELSTNRNNGNTASFYCPQKFTAKKISYTRQFDEYKRTNIGGASGWQTIVLPFQPTSITHPDKGTLAPFGSDIEGAKPFWLRKLTTEGFADVTVMEANKPYIIAMPNNPEIYLSEYNIYGTITFSAENVEISQTPDELPADAGPAYSLQPTYKLTEKGGLVYTLNYNYYISEYDYGSVFARSSDDVYPFEAYVIPNNDATARAIYTIDTRSSNTRSASQRNTSGIPSIGDM